MQPERDLIDYIFASFLRGDLDRGYDYFDRGRVQLEWEDDTIVGRVVGSSVYEVVLSRETRVTQNGNRTWHLGVNCTCPRFQRDYLCKHIAATVMAADESAVMGTLGWKASGFTGVGPLAPEEATRAWERVSRDEGTATKRLSTRRRMDTLEEELADLRPDLPDRIQPSDEDGDWMLWLVVDPSSWRYGDLAFDTYRQKPKLDGTLGKLSKMPVRTDNLECYQSEIDREILYLLLPLQEDVFEPSSYYREASSWIRLFLPDRLAPALLPQLLATGRVLVEDPNLETRERRVLRYDEGPPFELRVRIDDDPDARDFTTTVEGTFERTVKGRQELRPAGEALVARRLPNIPDAFLIFPDRVSRGRFSALDEPWLKTLVGHPPLRLGASERHRLQKLLRHHVTPELDAPSEFRPESRTIEPKPIVEVSVSKRGATQSANNDLYLDVKPLFDYGSIVLSPSDRRRVWPDEQDKNLRIQRDFDREAELLEQLLSTPSLEARMTLPTYPTHDSPDPPLVFLAPLPETAAQALRTLCSELGPEWKVFFDAQPVEMASEMEARIGSGVDWFELEGGVAFDQTEVTLPTLLTSVEKDDGVVALPSGAIGLVPESWMQPLHTLSGFGKEDKGKIRLEASQLLFFDHLLDSHLGIEVQFDRQAKKLIDRLRDFEHIQEAEKPSGFNGELRHYQKVGLGWLAFLREFGLGGCLADDMGLGKTIQVLALLTRIREEEGAEQQRPALVVAPRSVVENWVREAQVFAPGLTTLRHWGPKRKAALAEAGGLDGLHVDIVVTTYGTLRRDIDELGSIAWDTVVLDEAQAIKNSKAKTSRAARRLLARQRIALTGTPVENHLGELASIFEFLNPGMTGLESLRGLKRRDLEVSESELTLASNALRPLILRRTKEAVLDDLPPKTEATLFCELGPQQRRAYRELLEYYQRSVLGSIEQRGLGRSKIHVLEALLRLRQAACHPGLISDSQNGIPSAKFDVLLENLDACLDSGHKALVFSQFTSLLALLRPILDHKGYEHLYLDGKTRKRQQLVDRFQNEEDPKLFLISLRAGGLGLNLTAADYVFVLDPWWNPAVETQAIDRAHRIGQTRPVFAYRLLAKDTVEERIAQLQEKKKALSDAILGEDKSLMEKLTREDLELLLS